MDMAEAETGLSVVSADSVILRRGQRKRLGGQDRSLIVSYILRGALNRLRINTVFLRVETAKLSINLLDSRIKNTVILRFKGGAADWRA